ncbi:transporter [Paramyrothecium foliicola]|nr:transporter [Paramyrothecium foliicola]
MSTSVEEKPVVDGEHAAPRTPETGEKVTPSTHEEDGVSSTDETPIDPKAERKLVMKLDLVIYPVFFVVYMMSFLDRINISNARIQGMTQDLDLHSNRFNVALLVYYVGYILLEIPSNMIISRVRPSLYLSGLMFIWGLINMCMGFVHSYEALVGLRFLLGVFEAGVLPGIIFVTSNYYKRHEYQKRMSFFFCSTVVAGAFGGLLAYAIAGLGGKAGLAAWRWIFIIEGALTSVLAIVFSFLIIDWPHQTKYLNAEEKELLRRRMAADVGDVCRMDTMNKTAVKRSLMDYKIWLAAFLYMGVSVAGLGGTFFLPSILTEFGWKAREAQIRTIPIYACAAGCMLIGAWLSDRLKHRFGFIMTGAVMATIGYSMLLNQTDKSRDYKFGAVFPIFGGAYMITPMCLAWLQNNLSGQVKRAFGSSTQVMVGNVAGIIGAYIYLPNESPLYKTGYGTSLGFMWFGALCAATMAGLMWRENKKRDAGERDHMLNLPEDERTNLGDHHPSFRFTLGRVKPLPKMYTASFAFFEAIWDAGVTHCFVNLGSDHPSIMEAMAKGQRGGKFPRIITCPSEMVAMSMADGFARVTGQPQAVIVHVDVGTQALGVAVHNASVGRCPVLVFAGMSPCTQEGELPGSRTEFIHWLQDIPDQKAIVGQYCRYAAEIKTGVNIKQMINRSLQFATSDPQGPVYLCATREVLEGEIKPYTLNQAHWQPVEIGGLPSKAADLIADALASAKSPLIVTGYSGRNLQIPGALVRLADIVKSLRVLDAAGSDMCFPADHDAWLGVKQGSDASIPEADVILVLHCDVPWIPTLCKPKEDTRIFHIDIDPLKQQMPLFYLNAEARYRADALTSIEQIISSLGKDEIAQKLTAQNLTSAEETRHQSYTAKLEAISNSAVSFDDGSFGTGYLSKVLRSVCPEDIIWVSEAVTNTGFIHSNVRPTVPGSWINCGAGGLGWSGGAALGIKLATDAQNSGKGKFICHIVGDGTFLFSIPGSVYWISKRYKIPILTIVLNNNGWNAPRKSLMLVIPDGDGMKASNEDINISFNPPPDYAGIAAAAGAGDVHALRVTKANELESVLRDAVSRVQAGQTTVVDCKVVPDC